MSLVLRIAFERRRLRHGCRSREAANKKSPDAAKHRSFGNSQPAMMIELGCAPRRRGIRLLQRLRQADHLLAFSSVRRNFRRDRDRPAVNEGIRRCDGGLK